MKKNNKKRYELEEALLLRKGDRAMIRISCFTIRAKNEYDRRNKTVHMTLPRGGGAFPESPVERTTNHKIKKQDVPTQVFPLLLILVLVFFFGKRLHKSRKLIKK